MGARPELIGFAPEGFFDMAKSSVSQWDTTADNNTDIGGISLAENVMAPPAVNNAIREMMAQMKDFYDDLLHKDAGLVGYFPTTPNGWLKANGQTIGNGSSGATARANADTETLYLILWAAFTNTILPIQDSSGTATTRGASAAADFAANKRLPLLDLRAEFIRGLDDGRGVDTSRTLGSAQADAFEAHTHTGTAESAGAHSHTVGPFYTTGGGAHFPLYDNADQSRGNLTTSTAGAHTHTLSIDETGGTETRPRNIALLACIKY